MADSRLLSLLKIRTAEAYLTFLVALFFALIELGRGLGGSAADALFFRRFGVEYLPYMYVALGVATFFVSLAYAAFVGRLEKGRFFTLMLLAMALVLLAERAAILLDMRGLYPVLWLSVNLMASLLGTMAWNIAGEVCDTRQAKRLFPIFVSAGILGGLAGSLLTGPAARFLGTENLLVMYGVLLIAALVTVRTIARRHFAAPAAGHRGASSSFLADIRTGYDYVRRSPLLQRLAISAVLFSVLYFSVSFPFGRAVSASFTSEADMAGFLGLFNGIASVLMFGAALLIANRLYARIGIVNALLVLPITYLFGFVLLAANFSMPSAIIARLSQLVVLSGVADGAYSAFFNVAPAEKRAQVRAFDSGVPTQIGTILSGILLILGERVLNNSQIFVMGMAVAAVCGVVVWRMRRSYVLALVGALRAGRFDVFTAGERVFSGFQDDASAIRIVVGALDDPKPTTQQLAAEMLGRMGAVTAAPHLIRRLDAVAAEVKAAFIRTLASLGVREAASPVAALLADPSPAVRKVALDALPAFYPKDSAELERLVRPLRMDADFEVRAQALASLAILSLDQDALRCLITAAGQPPVEQSLISLRALEAVFEARPSALENGLAEAAQAVTRRLEDDSAAVREAACRVLRAATTEKAVGALVRRLSDSEGAVRMAAARALRAIGAPASQAVLAALQTSPGAEHDAALAALSPDDPTIDEPLRSYAHAAINRVQQWRSLARAVPKAGHVTGFLVSELEAQSSQHARRLVAILGLLGDQEAMELVARSLDADDVDTQAAALEALDVLGDRRLVKALLPLLEEKPPGHEHDAAATGAVEAALRQIISERSGWLQALAIRAVGELELHTMLPDLYVLRDAADPIAREAAHDALLKLGEKMETLATMSLMERVLLLKEVPLFKDLQPDDLGKIAEMAHERWFSDGTALCHEGESGHELFIVAAGRVRVTKQSDGHDRLLATRGVGEFIGEMAIIDAVPRFATVRAEGEARTLVITSNAFRAILRDRPEVSLAVIHGLSRRLREQGQPAAVQVQHG